MTRKLTFLTTYFVVLNLVAQEPIPHTKEVSAAIRVAIMTASSAKVYEGLPHPSKVRDLWAAESKRPDTIEIDSYWFTIRR